MRFLLSLSAAALCFAFLPSCTTPKSNVTKGDIATFKLRDLTRFGQPHLVKVSPKEIEEMDQVALKKGRVAKLDRKFVPAPVDYVPPRLPANRIGFDGSILPPKDDGSPAVLDSGYPAAVPQDFSIE